METDLQTESKYQKKTLDSPLEEVHELDCKQKFFIFPFIRCQLTTRTHCTPCLRRNLTLWFGFPRIVFNAVHCSVGAWVLLWEPQRPHIITRMLGTRPYDAHRESGLYCSDCTKLALLARQHRPVSACPWFGEIFQWPSSFLNVESGAGGFSTAIQLLHSRLLRFSSCTMHICKIIQAALGKPQRNLRRWKKSSKITLSYSAV